MSNYSFNIIHESGDNYSVIRRIDEGNETITQICYVTSAELNKFMNDHRVFETRESHGSSNPYG